MIVLFIFTILKKWMYKMKFISKSKRYSKNRFLISEFLFIRFCYYSKGAKFGTVVKKSVRGAI